MKEEKTKSVEPEFEKDEIMADVGDKNVTKNGQVEKIGKLDAKEVVEMIVRDYGDVLKRLSKT